MHDPVTGVSPDPAAPAQLARDGYVTVRGICTPSAAARVRDAVRRAMARRPHLVPTDAEGEAYARAFRQHTGLCAVDPEVAAFVRSPRLAALAAALLGVAAVRVYHDQALCKLAGGGATPWHQDKHYWPVDGPMVTVWMPLVELTPAMGELRFARGSHRRGALTERPISAASEQELSRLVQRERFEVVGSGAMAAGDSSWHLDWTLHGAAANCSGVAREVMTVIFVAAGARVIEPTNDGQRADLAAWLPGLRPGDVIA